MSNIVVVDDSKFMRLSLKHILTNGGFNVVGEAEDGLVAIEMYKKFKPDLMTLDITMPNLDGIEALMAIKMINPQAKVVICSSMGQKAFIEDAIKYGAIDFIVKPFHAKSVLEIINRALKK